VARKVKITILKDGSVKADFIGFGGTDCLDEADRLASSLARFGLRAVATSVERKTLAQIEAETGPEDTGREPVPARRE
jgi:hypothetical protein